LAVLAQLLLANEPELVEEAADLLHAVLDRNPAANAKLYLTGRRAGPTLFVFGLWSGLRWVGSHRTSLAKDFFLYLPSQQSVPNALLNVRAF
jgi:hypothetical protein